MTFAILSLLLFAVFAFLGFPQSSDFVKADLLFLLSALKSKFGFLLPLDSFPLRRNILLPRDLTLLREFDLAFLHSTVLHHLDFISSLPLQLGDTLSLLLFFRGKSFSLSFAPSSFKFTLFLGLLSLTLFDSKLALTLSLCSSQSNSFRTLALGIHLSFLGQHNLMSLLSLNLTLLGVFCSLLLKSDSPGVSSCLSSTMSTDLVDPSTSSLGLLLRTSCISSRYLFALSSRFNKLLLMSFTYSSGLLLRTSC